MRNTNRWDTKTLVTMALLAAIAAALSFIEVPFIAVSFLKYDAGNVPALVGGFVFGPVPGIIIGTIGAFVHGLIMGDWGGFIMNTASVIAHVVPAALIYKHRKTLASGIAGLIVGALAATAVMVGMNLLIDPIFYGYSYEMIIGLIAPVLVPFNLIKTVINSVLCILIYKPISNLVKPKERHAKGVVVEEDVPATQAGGHADEAE